MASAKKPSKKAGAAKSGAAKKAPAKKATPSVMEFLAKLGGAPQARGRQTPAKGLLGDIRREDLIEAGRIDAESTEGPPPEVEVSLQRPDDVAAFAGDDGAGQSAADDGGPGPAGRRAERFPFGETLRVSSVVAGASPLGLMGGPETDGNSRAQNLSSTGIFIETDRLLEVGDPIVVAFPGAAGVPMNVSGRVRWVTAFGTAEGRSGMGIEFVGLDERKRERLENLLRGLPRTSPEGP